MWPTQSKEKIARCRGWLVCFQTFGRGMEYNHQLHHIGLVGHAATRVVARIGVEGVQTACFRTRPESSTCHFLCRPQGSSAGLFLCNFDSPSNMTATFPSAMEPMLKVFIAPRAPRSPRWKWYESPAVIALIPGLLVSLGIMLSSLATSRLGESSREYGGE